MGREIIMCKNPGVGGGGWGGGLQAKNVPRSNKEDEKDEEKLVVGRATL